MRVAVDAMGGDYAPEAVVSGSVEAVRKYDGIRELILVGDAERVRAELSRHEHPAERVRVVHASQKVEMGESPTLALRRKKDSSIARAVDLVKKGEAEAVVSAGNTGAVVVATKIKLRTLEQVLRPAIGTFLPSPQGGFLLIDAGANIDCKADHLFQFAVMGSIFVHEVIGRPDPKIGLLSIGEEEAKGNDLTRGTFAMLERAPLNFVGNVEGRDLFERNVDVVVCDGFVGNVVLKTSESVASAMQRWLREELTRNPVRMLGAALARGAFRSIARRGDYAEYGGAPLLGIRGTCIIAHGSSSPKAICNAIHAALRYESHEVNRRISEELERAYAALRS